MFLYKNEELKPGLLQSRIIRFTLASVFHYEEQMHNQSRGSNKPYTGFPPKLRHCKPFASPEPCRVPQELVLFQPSLGLWELCFLFPHPSCSEWTWQLLAVILTLLGARACRAVGTRGMKVREKEGKHLLSVGKLQKQITMLWPELPARCKETQEQGGTQQEPAAVTQHTDGADT